MDKQRKILMIGNKDSGKTTYMASAYGIMKDGKYGFFVRGDNDSDDWLMTLYSKIKRGQYPLPTDKRGQFSFDLYYYQKNILSFEWIDYFGGVITGYNEKQLGKDIDGADAIMIFLEASALLENRRSATQFRRIQALLTEKLVNADHYFDVIVVVTKYDMIGDRATFEEVCSPLGNFSESISGKDNIYFRIVPVSCTSNGFVNVDLPLIDILHSGLGINYLSHLTTAQENLDKARDYNNQRGVIDWLISRAMRVRTNGELADEHAQAALKEAEICEQMEEPYKKLSQYRENYNVEIPTARVQPARLTGDTRGRFDDI